MRNRLSEETSPYLCNGDIAVLMQGGAGGKPDVNVFGVPTSLTGSRLDFGDRVVNHLWRQTGSGNHAIAGTAA
jgi:hypothetical protein